MKQYIWSLIKKYFAKEILQISTNAVTNENQRRCIESKKSKLYELNDWVGKIVIGLSNNIDNPVIGFAMGIDEVGQNSEPVLLVRDYITNKEYLVLGQIFEYNPILLKTIIESDQRSIKYLLYKSPSIFKQEYQRSRLLSYSEIVNILRLNGLETDVE